MGYALDVVSALAHIHGEAGGVSGRRGWAVVRNTDTDTQTHTDTHTHTPTQRARARERGVMHNLPV